jgi:hypothetical protein
VIVDKKNDLNIYKEDTRKKEKDKPTTASACCSTDTKEFTKVEEKLSSCCGSIQTACRTGSTEEESEICCTTSSVIGEEITNRVADIDFNEWVGKFIIPFDRQGIFAEEGTQDLSVYTLSNLEMAQKCGVLHGLHSGLSTSQQRPTSCWSSAQAYCGVPYRSCYVVAS